MPGHLGRRGRAEAQDPCQPRQRPPRKRAQEGKKEKVSSVGILPASMRPSVLLCTKARQKQRLAIVVYPFPPPPPALFNLRSLPFLRHVTSRHVTSPHLT